MKKLVSIILALTLLLTFSSCSSSDKNNASVEDGSNKNKEPTKITFALDWTPNTNHTGLYVAKDKGWYEDAGLDVNIVFVEDSSSAALCSANEAQFAIEAQDTLAAALIGENPLEVTAVAAILQHNTSCIMSRHGEGLDRPLGLTGKTYATWDSPIEKAMLENVVEADGGDFDSIKLVPNNFDDEPSALEAKQTDAIWVFYGWAGINAEIKGFNADYFYFKDLNPVFDYYTPIIIANNEFLKNNPDAAKAFLSATRKGYEYAMQNPDEAAEILIDSDDSLKDSEELVKESQNWMVTQYVADAEQWGYIDPYRWNSFYSWLFNEGLIETPIPENKGFTNEYLGIEPEGDMTLNENN